jgi:long-subunit fatty acid transport protein
VCALAGALIANAAVARAQIGVSLNRVGSGARAAGMGDAFIAVSDDGTAASWNPAGLAQLRQPEFSLVYVVSNNGTRFAGLRSPDDRVAYSTRRASYSNSSVDFASAAVPFSVARKPVTLQIGWHRLYQLGAQVGGNVERHLMDPPGAPPTSVTVDDRLVGNIDVISVAGAVKLTSRAAVGGSLDVWRGSWAERQSLVEDPGSPGSSAFLSRNSHQRLRGTSFTAGLLLTYPSWNAGLVYHAPFWSSFRFGGDSHTSGGPLDPFEVRGARFRLPRSIGAGLSRRFAARWTAAVAVTHDQWTDALLDRLPREPSVVNFLDGAPPELSTARDTLSLNAGIEHLFLREGSVVPVRVGFGWEPQGSMDPVTRDPVDFLFVSGGGGYNTNRFKFDASVQYRWTGFRISDVLSVRTALLDGFARDAIGRASTHEWRVKVSAIYRMPDTDKLRGVLKKIFG